MCALVTGVHTFALPIYNVHVRVTFATNDERTAKRISDALGTATELRAQRNYAGHRLSPWLGHLMVSRQETARQLLTPGEVMQLPPDDEIVMVRSEEHTSELQSLMRISYAVFCLKKKK